MDDVHGLPMSSREIELENEIDRLEATNAKLLVTLKRIWATQLIKDYPLAIKIDKLITAAEEE